VNYTVPVRPTGSTFALIANPLNSADNNSLVSMLPTPPENTTIYLFRSGGFQIIGYSLGEWESDTSIAPGEGFFVELDPTTASNPTVLTFVGEVPQGTLNNTVPAGFSIRSSQVPQAGLLQTDLELTPGEDDTVYQFNVGTQSYVINGFSLGEWDPAELTVGVGESFWYENRNTEFTWSRTFSVN
jgi:hypothetical protein